jgi:hypothetical protein
MSFNQTINKASPSNIDKPSNHPSGQSINKRKVQSINHYRTIYVPVPIDHLGLPLADKMKKKDHSNGQSINETENRPGAQPTQSKILLESANLGRTFKRTIANSINN